MATRVWIAAVWGLVTQVGMDHPYLDLVRCIADLEGLSGIPCDMNVLGRCSRLDTDRSGQWTQKKTALDIRVQRRLDILPIRW